MPFDLTFALGVLGGAVLVLGAAWPSKDCHPVKSLKNWLLAGGTVLMALYSWLNYLDGGPIFFLLLQILIIISSVLMMLDTDDRIDAAVLSVAGLGLVIWSLYLFEGYLTLFFIFGLIFLGIGYALDMGSIKRSAMLTLGSALIALFSYLTQSWIFFWLNVFFALFSGYYLVLGIRSLKKK